LKILLVNTFDHGGAANSCFRLRRGLLNVGIDVKLLLQKKTKNFSSVEVAQPLLPKISRTHKARKALRKVLKEFNLYKNKAPDQVPFLWKRASQLEMFSYPNSNFDLTASNFYDEAEIINLHWVANFLDFKSFFKKNQKPVVWTLHDMNPFTGGEHYAELFTGIDENGLPIKRVLSDFEREEFKKVIERKKEAIIDFKNLTIVAPSQWLADKARKSEVFKGRPVYCIPNGLDHETFTPRDKAFCRELLNIPLDKKMILFVADSISIHRKGFLFLKRAIQQLKRKDVIFCAVGNNDLDFGKDKDIIQLGSINDERLMSVVYSAADVFVIPSLMDNLPNTVLESLMCGTPVIGFPTGGIPEMVEHQFNGLITNEISVPALAQTIDKFLEEPNHFDREKIREDAIKKYDQKVQAQKYQALFEEILSNDNSH
jgi:glycosyltransferase involved in cell wall biosynthesis